MGKILDIYFQFAVCGDYYLGWLLSLKDPNSLEFDTPYLHWKNPNAPIVLAALDLMFGQIYMAHGHSPVTPMVFCPYFLPPLFIILIGCWVSGTRTLAIHPAVC